MKAPWVVLEPSWELWKPCWSHLEAKKPLNMDPENLPNQATETTRAENVIPSKVYFPGKGWCPGFSLSVFGPLALYRPLLGPRVGGFLSSHLSHFWNWMFLEDRRNRGMSELLLALWPLVALAPIAGHAFRSSFGAPGDFFPRTCRISGIGGFLRLPEIVGRLS